MCVCERGREEGISDNFETCDVLEDNKLHIYACVEVLYSSSEVHSLQTETILNFLLN